MKTMTQVLLDAKLLVLRGWRQRALRDGHGNVCLLGALIEASEVGDGQSVRPIGTYSAIHDAQKKLFPQYCSPVEFNNSPDSTKADVLSVFDEAILSTSEPPQVDIKKPARVLVSAG